ncbi:DNA-directed RNA polymerase III subunit RPC3-like isoform X2 [Acanthaster planci]|uniref:DNA-directed RNA polymerase III subunit RPC3 n=1 Tax=Acanthaster planci TaxID=133434 RepID=A0A8B8A242_ACAPL|nr:DNA-directed RNA polymerase III subunit RPC3-like isoform X2 [Acanthaster planci]
MSVCQIHLVSLLIKEHFGDIVEKVCTHLIKNGAKPLRIASQETGLKLDQVRKALCVLIQHNIASFGLHKRGFVEYTASVDRALLLVRYPRYIYCAKTLYGDAGELIVEEILQHGQMMMSSMVARVTQRLSEGGQPVTADDVKEKMEDLIHTHFLQRVPAPPTNNGNTTDANVAIPKLFISEQDLYRVPASIEVTLEKDSSKRKRSTEDDDPQRSSKRLKIENAEHAADEGILWHLNFERFHKYLLDHEIVQAVSRRIDWNAAEVVRTMLRISELSTGLEDKLSKPISINDLMRHLPVENRMKFGIVEQYFKLLSDDQTGIVKKTDEAGGGTYIIDFQNACRALVVSTIESVVQERFGSKSFRIFKTLLLKKYLEQKQVEEFALIPAKEAKELLYKMFSEHFVTVQEIPRTPDHAPSRTFYLFMVEVGQVSRMLLERCYKALANLVCRRAFETKENKRLIEKSQRVEAIAASLQSDGADQSQTAEVEDMITPLEKNQLEKYRGKISKLEQSELQVDCTIFTLGNFLLQEAGS